MLMARNITPNDMVNSVLFKRVAPHIQSISQSQLVFELCLASTTTNVDINYERADINLCMTWCNTPQDDEFWQPLHTEYTRNKANAQD